jgi:hypothetical protein
VTEELPVIAFLCSGLRMHPNQNASTRPLFRSSDLP